MGESDLFNMCECRESTLLPNRLTSPRVRAHAFNELTTPTHPPRSGMKTQHHDHITNTSFFTLLPTLLPSAPLQL